MSGRVACGEGAQPWWAAGFEHQQCHCGPAVPVPTVTEAWTIWPVPKREDTPHSWRPVPVGALEEEAEAGASLGIAGLGAANWVPSPLSAWLGGPALSLHFSSVEGVLMEPLGVLLTEG